MSDPPGRARLAYHPRETFDDRGGWSTERVFFHGVDGSWRSLEMADLGLPETAHPGVDTYGAGSLSPDGTTWASRTSDGIVLVNLATAQVQVVALAGKHTSYLDWHPGGGHVDVVRFSGLRTYRTWSVDVSSLDATRATYALPIDGFAEDGSVVTFSRRGTETVRTAHRDDGREISTVAVPYRLARSGGAVGSEHTVFGVQRDLVAADALSGSPSARLHLRRNDAVGWPRGWLDRQTVWFAESRRGLLAWNVATGEVRILVRVTPPARVDSYWNAAVASDLIG